MKTVAQFFNRRSYPVFSLILLGSVIALQSLNGLSGPDMIVLAGLVIILFAVWQVLQPAQSKELTSRELFEQSLRQSGRPTIVEFFSSYCVGCMAVRPLVDRLEQEAGSRLQIMRLNVDREPGKSLAEEYDVVFTPTFVHFDSSGSKLRETVGILDHARILYDLEQPR